MRSSPGDLSDVLAVRQASRVMVRELGMLQAMYVPSGLATSHCHALMEIGDSPGMTAGTLADALRLDKSTTSRIVGHLIRRGWVRVARDRRDARRRALALTAKGRTRVAGVHRTANARVASALGVLTNAERQRVREGLALYARALDRSRRRTPLTLRPVRRADNRSVAAIIRTVMTEYGAVGAGYSINDAEVDDIFGAYPRPRARYYVITDGARVLGGGGYGPLAGGGSDTCELRKMYFLKEARGLGLGEALLSRAMDAARADGYRRMYLETLKSMTDAARLYERKGFVRAAGPLGCTDHFGCDAWYALDL